MCIYLNIHQGLQLPYRIFPHSHYFVTPLYYGESPRPFSVVARVSFSAQPLLSGGVTIRSERKELFEQRERHVTCCFVFPFSPFPFNRRIKGGKSLRPKCRVTSCSCSCSSSFCCLNKSDGDSDQIGGMLFPYTVYTALPGFSVNVSRAREAGGEVGEE